MRPDPDGYPTQEEIEDCVAYWTVALGLEQWRIAVRTFPVAGEQHAAHCSKWDGAYFTGEIMVRADKVKRWELHATVIHELASHPLIWPVAQQSESMAGKNRRLRRLVSDAEEQTATMLEHLILRLHPPPA